MEDVRDTKGNQKIIKTQLYESKYVASQLTSLQSWESYFIKVICYILLVTFMKK